MANLGSLVNGKRQNSAAANLETTAQAGPKAMAAEHHYFPRIRDKFAIIIVADNAVKNHFGFILT